MDLIISVPGGEGRWEVEGASHTQSENGSYHQCAGRGGEVGGRGEGRGRHKHGERIDLIISVPGGGGGEGREGRGHYKHGERKDLISPAASGRRCASKR